MRRPSTVLALAFLIGATSAPEPARGDGPSQSAHVPRPWRPRQREGVTVQGLTEPTIDWQELTDAEPPFGALTSRDLRRLGLRPRGMGLVDLSAWPEEPESPGDWDRERFAHALAQLCPPGVSKDARQYAHLILEVAQVQGVDPALLGALVYHQSHCLAQRASSWGAGLTMLNRGLFPSSVRQGVYRYAKLEAAQWQPQRLPLTATKLSHRALLDPYTNLSLAAALLRVLGEQCPDMDVPFRSKPHRHHVSHFIWGDEVKDAGAEDRILEVRRRLLEYYHGVRIPLYAEVESVLLVSPLDGAPRIATSGLGDDRDSGHRRHAGIDYLSRFGEPVRAVADGRVVRAGTDLSGDRKVDVDPNRASLVPPAAMGARGLFVEIDHAQGLHSVYAHLASYTVRAGDRIRRGDLLGYVGRSGIRDSDPHLHFGLFHKGQVLDPLLKMHGLVFGPERTMRGPTQHSHELLPRAERRRRLRGRRRQRAKSGRRARSTRTP